MKHLLKQNFIGFLAFLLVFSGMVFVFPEGASQAAASTPTAAAATVEPVVVVARGAAQPKVEAVSQPQAAQNVCGFSAQDAWLQNTVAAALFTKPAGCFSINQQKIIAATQTLKVSNLPAVYPKIVVLNYPDRIQDEYGMPAYPVKDQAGMVPVAVALAVLLAFVFGKPEPEKKILKIKERLNAALTLEKLCLLRC